MKHSIQTWLFSGLFLLTPVVVVAQDSPQLIPFQGRLTDQSGTAYDNGQFTVTFNLYGQAVGGASEWTERHEKVGVINGMINVFLGSIQDLSGVDFSSTKHLGITVDADGNAATADPEMVPRQMIIPAFYAKNSQKLAGHNWTTILEGGSNDPSTARIAGDRIQNNGITADKIASSAVTSDEILDESIEVEDLSLDALSTIVPTGVILPYGGALAKVPPGWHPCDGRTLSRTQYARLYNTIHNSFGHGDGSTTFHLPDLRGRFIRGLDQGTGRDPDVNQRNASAAGGNQFDGAGSVQDDALQGFYYSRIDRIRHSGSNSGGTTSNSVPEVGENDPGVEFAWADGQRAYVRNANAVPRTNPTYGGIRLKSETRPKNVYVYYIIKD